MTENSLERLLEEFQLLAIDLMSQRDYPLQARKPVLELKNKYFEAPAAKNLFVGREALLEQVSTAFIANPFQSGNHLAHDPRTPSSSINTLGTQAPSSQSEHESRQHPATGARLQQRFVIYGLSGSGKTEFCLKFCERNQRQ